MTPMEEARRAVNAYWKYDPDGPIDHWSYTSPGDCENYALLILKEIKGSKARASRALLQGEAHIWFAKTFAGNGHAVLEYNGKFIDNRIKKWVDDPKDLKLAELKYRYSRVQLAAKLGFGAIYSAIDDILMGGLNAFY